MGPTGVGKTGASILLARELRTEIISADSMQIYRGMDIGTAKPSLDERAGVRHHMIDVADPAEGFSTGRYIESIVPVIEHLHGQGKVPLIVGGTGLYIRAITRGIFCGPSADWDLREELLSIERESPGSLYLWLRYRDPEAAARIEKNDTRRILRAIEVCIKGQQSMSSFQERLTSALPYEFVKVGLTRERKELYRLIDSRVDSMVRAGLKTEVEEILKTSPDRTALQAIGYKEFLRFFAGELAIEEVISLVKRNSRRYAKRQFTWFRKEDGVTWMDITGVYDSRSIFERLKECLEKMHADLFGLFHSSPCTDLQGRLE